MAQVRGGLISGVTKKSPAYYAGVKAGDTLLSVDGTKVRDILDVSFLSAEDTCELELMGPDGSKRRVSIEKDVDENLGLSFESAVFDGVRLCANHCVFCFVDRMIPGLRNTLYVRDDDYRLSFLYGNFITLTNLTEEDFQRIIAFHLSPLCVSVHATDGAVRSAMMGQKRAADLMPLLERLIDAGIRIQAQVVCCPGINDGAVLEKTFEDLYGLRRGIDNMAVVPVGITRHTAGLTKLSLFDAKGAKDLIGKARLWQQRCRKELGRTFIHLADEFYILAGEDFPEDAFYDGYPQIENGIGLSRNFVTDWQKEEARSAGRAISAQEPFAVPVGVGAFKTVDALIKDFNARYGASHMAVAVPNDFFGHTVNVTGLLTGSDILKNLPEGFMVALPAVTLNSDGVFLDDMSPKDLIKTGKRVFRARTGADLFDLLSGIRQDEISGDDAPHLPNPNPAGYVRQKDS